MNEIGIWKDQEEYRGRFAVHIDCFHWVQRDSYLPQGSQGAPLPPLCLLV